MPAILYQFIYTVPQPPQFLPWTIGVVDFHRSRISIVLQLHLKCLSLIYFKFFLCLQPFLPNFIFFSPKMYTIYTYQVRFFKLKFLQRVISLVFSPRSENTGTFSSLFAKFDCFQLHFVWFCLQLHKTALTILIAIFASVVDAKFRRTLQFEPSHSPKHFL